MEYSCNSSCPDSGDSSPPSCEIEFENPPLAEESQGSQLPSNYRVKFMCSYGGKIHPRPSDNQLSYIGGDTKILAVDRSIRFGALLARLAAICDSESISFKYQLPGEDLDALISVTNDEDMEHMMHEYERLWRASPKPARLRIFIFQALSHSLSLSTWSNGSDEVKSEKERFIEALNSAPMMAATLPEAPPAAAQTPAVTSNVDFLFGLEKSNAMAGQLPAQIPSTGKVAEVEDPVVLIPVMDEQFTGLDPIQKHVQDLQKLRLEEQQGVHQKIIDDNLSGLPATGECFKVPDKISQVAIHGGVPYWADNQIPSGFYSVNIEQPTYMIPPPSSVYHAPPMVRPVTGPSQGYYTVQRMPPDVYPDRQQQQQMYNIVPQAAAGGYSDGFGMAPPGGFSHVAYDSSMGGRQVVYAPPGSVMGAPAPMQPVAPYQGVAGGAAVDMRQGGAVVPETAGKGVITHKG